MKRILWTKGLPLAILLGVATPALAAFQYCNESLAKLVYQEASVAKAQYLGYQTVANNDQFIALVEKPLPPGMLFFHVENAILKQMNDQILQDKELSASLQALYVKTFLIEMEKEPQLKPLVMYSDYKSLRLGFTQESPALREALSKVYRRSANHFRTEIKKMPGLYTLFRRIGGELVKNPSAWNLAGLGATPDEAALVSRTARDSPPIEVGVPELHSFGEPQIVSELLNRWQRQKQWSERAFRLANAELGSDNRIFIRTGNGRHTLNQDAIEVLRKLEGMPEVARQKEMKERFYLRFGKIPSDQLIEALRNYLKSAEGFAPSIYERNDQKNMGVGSAREGLLTFDLAGQNVRNLEALLEVLNTYPAEVLTPVKLTGLTTAIRKSQNKASARFDVVRGAIELALSHSGMRGTAYASGDDVVFVPKEKLTLDERENILDAVHVIGEGRVRMIYVAPLYSDTAKEISEVHRAAASGEAEALEKQIRWQLERNGANLARLQRMTFCIEVSMESDGGKNLHIRTKGKSGPNLLSSDIEAVARSLEPSARQISVEDRQ